MSLDLPSAVQWWEEWQLRILVLGSLFLQLFLFVASKVRNLRMPSLCRSCIWLAYLGADALAIYALATLFNRHNKNKPPAAGGGAGADVLEVVWAPVLLIHLGGQHPITAYSIEDNELWRRHLVTLVSQVTVALYVFCSSWPRDGDRRLLQAAILLFVVGIVKFIRKPWFLRSASISGVMASSAVYPQRREESPLRDTCEFLCLSFHTTLGASVEAEEMREEEEHDLSLEEYIERAKELVLLTEVDAGCVSGEPFDMDKLFLDLSAPYSHRLRKLGSFLKFNQENAYEDLKSGLSAAFELIYTNFKGVCSVYGFLLHLLLPFLLLASLVLFTKIHHKHGHYKESDVRVTMALLCCTTLLEFLPCFFSPCLLAETILSSTVAQSNLISFYARESKPTKLMKLSAMIGCQGYVNQHWYIEQAAEPACLEVLNLVSEHVKNGWKLYIVDAPSYKRFNNFRGQWTLSKHKLCARRSLWWWSLQVSFDRSVLVWHVVTELCLHHPRTSPGVAVELPAARCSRLISNYMIYLLSMHPEMLMPGSRQALFMAANDDIKRMLKHDDEPPLRSGRTVAQRIISTARLPLIYPGTLIPRARDLAEDLMEVLDNQEERWKVIQGVWVEMLCCSAGRCRGYLHAKSMGEGTELLTFVWLLLLQMGMENFADKFQKPEHGEGEEIASGSSPASKPQEEEISIV